MGYFYHSNWISYKTNSSIYPESLREFRQVTSNGQPPKGIEPEKLKARLEESKGYLITVTTTTTRNDAAMLPSKQVSNPSQQQLDSIIEEGDDRAWE